VMVAGAVTGWLLVARDSEWYHALVPHTPGDGRVPGATREQLMQSLGTEQSADGLSAFAGYLFSNNAGVAILAFAMGFAFGVPSLLLLMHNMALLGALLWLFNGQGLTLELVTWLSVHGTTELFAILLAGAAGLHVGRSMAFPGSRSIMVAASQAGQRAALVMAGVVLMLIVAALLEGFARQLFGSVAERLAIGGTMLALWLGYFFAFRGGGLGRQE